MDPFTAGLIATPFAAVILYLSPHMFAAAYGGLITGQLLTASLQRRLAQQKGSDETPH